MVNISHITQPGEAPNDRMPDGSEVPGSGTDRRDSYMHNRITDVSELSHGLGSHCLNACSHSRIPANRRLAMSLLYSLNGNSSTEHISAPPQSEMSSEAVCRSVQGRPLTDHADHEVRVAKSQGPYRSGSTEAGADRRWGADYSLGSLWDDDDAISAVFVVIDRKEVCISGRP